MTAFTEIIRGLEPEKFTEIFAASVRSSRETYFSRHGIKAPKKSSRILRAGAKNEMRTAALFERLQSQDDDEMVEEMLRAYLMTKRPMLAVALDFMGIDNDDGLTESEDISRFEKVKGGELKKLIQALSEVAPPEDIAVYLKFMGVPKVDSAL